MTQTKQSKASKAPFGKDVYARVAHISDDATTRDEFILRSLRLVSQEFKSPYAVVYLRDGSSVVQDQWYDDDVDPDFWRDSVQEFLTESLAERVPRARLFRGVSDNGGVAMLAVPIYSSIGATVGAIVLVVARDEQTDVQFMLSSLDSIVRFVSFAAGQIGTTPNTPKRGDATQGPHQSLTHSANYDTPEALAFAITNNLRNKLGCEQVSLGMVRRRQLRIISISGLDHVSRSHEGVRHIQAAMEECLDTDDVVVSQDAEMDSESTALYPGYLHKQWQAAAGGDAVASIPLHADERVVAVISVRRSRSEPFTESLVKEITTRVEPFAPALCMVHKSSRPLLTHVRDDGFRFMESLTDRKKHTTKITVTAFLIFVAWFCFGTVQNDVSVTCRLVPDQSRHLASPFEGLLQAVNVVEGDRVVAGQILATLNARELLRERAELLAEQNVLDLQKNLALAENLPTDFQLVAANQKLVIAKLRTLDARIAIASVTAPFDGLVVAGNWQQRVGSVVAKGETLFEIAPTDVLSLEIRIPETEVDDVHDGMGGRFALAARPERAFRFTIDCIDSTPEIINGESVYLAHASASITGHWTKPGMEGVAKIDVGKVAVWKTVFGSLIDYLHLKLWL
jgi:multidrug resistance efflux pump